MPFTMDETIGPYKLIEGTGRAGMAPVYKACRPVLDRYLAIKAIQAAYAEEKDFLTRPAGFAKHLCPNKY